MLSNAMLFLLRGVPVVYYGDEQGFVGHGIDQDARQDMFASQVASYNDQGLLGTDATTAVRELQRAASAVPQIAALAKLRQAVRRRCARGRQVVRAQSQHAGIVRRFALSATMGREIVRRVQHLDSQPISGAGRSRSRTSMTFTSAARRVRRDGQRAGQFESGAAAAGLRRSAREWRHEAPRCWRCCSRCAVDAGAGRAGAGAAPAPAHGLVARRQRSRSPVRVNGEGRPEYSIRARRQRRRRLVAARLHPRRRAQARAQFRRSAASSSAVIDETWEQPWGERRYVRNHCNEMRVTLREQDRGSALDVVFRVFDDGVGFRYEFPEQAALEAGRTSSRSSPSSRSPKPATAWWIPGGEWNRYEYLYNRTPLAEVAQAHTPITMKLASGLHVAIHEAALVDYAGMWLRRVDGPAAEGACCRRRRAGRRCARTRAVRHAVAHAADRRRRAGPVHVAISSSISTSPTSSATCPG